MKLSIKIVFTVAFQLIVSLFSCQSFSIYSNDSTNATNLSTTTESWFSSFINQVQVSIIGDRNNSVNDIYESSDFFQLGENLNESETDDNGTFYNLDLAIDNVRNVGSNFLQYLNSSWLGTNNKILDLSFDSYDQENITYDNQSNVSDRFWINHEMENKTIIQSAVVLMNDFNKFISMFGNGSNSNGSTAPNDITWSINSFVDGFENMINSPWMNKSIHHLSVQFDNWRNKMTYKDNYFLTLLFILQRFQQLSGKNDRFSKNLTSASQNPTFQSLDLHSIKRYGHIASEVYLLLEKSKQEMAESLDIEEDDILKALVAENTSDQHCPGFMIYVNHKEKDIVLAIRGTWSIRDIMMDLIGDSVPFLDGWTHRGMLQGATKVIKESEEVLKEAFMKFPDYTLVLCGHSLGGGAAELITLDMLYGESGRILGFSTRDRPISCFTFGAPPVFISNHIKVPFEVPEIISFINRADVVPTLSSGTFEKALEQISALDSLEFTLAEKSRIIFETMYHDFKTKCSIVKDTIGKLFETENLEASLGNVFENIMDQFEPSWSKTMNYLHNLTDFSLIQKDEIGSTLNWNHPHAPSPNSPNYNSTNELNLNYTQSNKAAKDFEEDRDYNDKVSEGLEMLKNWTNSSDHKFLEHPGRVYQIEDVIDENEGLNGCKMKQILWKLSPKQKKSLIKNIRLDIVNMVVDHNQYSYVHSIKAVADANRQKQVLEIDVQKKIFQNEGDKKLSTLENEILKDRKQAATDGEKYTNEKLAEANKLLFNNEGYVQLEMAKSLSTNKKFYFSGDQSPLGSILSKIIDEEKTEMISYD